MLSICRPADHASAGGYFGPQRQIPRGLLLGSDLPEQGLRSGAFDLDQ